MIYLDNAATSWPKPETVYRAVDYCLRHIGANPGRGGHVMARQAGQIIYETREALANLFAIADPSRLVFTANATEALNIALFGLIKRGSRVVTTALEHNAVARPLRQLESRGAKLKIVQCDACGIVDIDELERVLRQGVDVVVMSHASNVTGAVMPIADVGRITRAAGALLVVDAAQTAGVEDVDVQKMDVDILAFAGHKGLFGPQGTGGLYVGERAFVKPHRYGGTGSLSESDRQPDFLPDMLESGTPNTPGIAGLKAGVDFITTTGLRNIRSREQYLTGKLMQGLTAIERVTVYGPPAGKNRTAVVSFNVEGSDSGAVAYLLDREYGIACRAGLHCAPWAHRTAGTIAAGAIRFSPGYFNTDAEIDAAVAAVAAIAARGGA